jgi:hypothetical protein
MAMPVRSAPILVRIAVAAMALLAVAAGRAGADSFDRTVRIVNGTGATLVQLYGTSGGGWGSNRLRGGAIPPGGASTVNFDDGSGQCRFNVKAVFANGSEMQNNNIDVCQTRSFQFR